MRTIKFWILSIAGCLYIGSLVLSVIAFMTAWHGGDWLWYWVAFLSSSQLGFPLARVALWRDGRASLFGPVAELRQAIQNGDDTVATVVGSSLIGSRNVFAESGWIGPLRRPAAWGTIATLWSIAVLALAVYCVGVPLALGAGNRLVALLLAGAGLALGLVCVLLVWRVLGPLYVRIGIDGLRWRSPFGRMAFAPWRDARRYFSLTYARPLSSDRETLYALNGDTVALAWREGSATMSATSSHSPSLELRHLITERTGLPLRDVTAQAKRIALGARIQSGVSRPSKTEITHRLRVAGVVLSPFLLLALVSLIAMLGQAPFNEYLYARAHAHAALYHDPLTRANGAWPDNAFSHFDQGAYHLQRSENDEFQTYVAVPGRYDHALVEVRGRTGGFDNLGGVGLAISGPGNSAPLLTFRVAPEGSWWLERFHTAEPYDLNAFTRFDDMSAIHKGFGVSNQIAVLMNGSDFTFYVNGRYATGYHDDALRGGQVCLYLDFLSDSGDFSDFAVYPM